MKVLIFAVTLAAGFLGGIYSVKRATQAQKWALLVVYVPLAAYVAWHVPSRFSRYLSAVALVGGAPAIVRFVRILITKTQARRKAKAILRDYG